MLKNHPTARSFPRWASFALLPLILAPGLASLGASATLAQPSLPHRVTEGLSDLRPDEVLAPDPEAFDRGRQLLEAAVERQGGGAWSHHRTLELTGLDRWSEPGPWWPHQNQRLRMKEVLGSFTSSVEFLDGPATGGVWGLQSWRPYHRDKDGAAAVFLETGDPHALPMRFYLPSLHYFNELPFRLLEAPVAIAAGERTLGEKTFDLVYVAWQEGGPVETSDQYVVWIARDTGRIEKAHYTVREAASFPSFPEDQRAMVRAGSAGTVHYSNFREIEGVWFPFLHVVTMFGPEQAPNPPASGFVHALEVESVAFDTFPPEQLSPNPELPAPADSKPEP